MNKLQRIAKISGKKYFQNIRNISFKNIREKYFQKISEKKFQNFLGKIFPKISEQDQIDQ